MNFLVNEDQVRKFARFIKNHLDKIQVLLLSGEIGTGKTTFSRYFIEESGTKHEFSSPTYTILNMYDDIHPKILHFDFYRMTDADIEWINEMIEMDTKCIVEWFEYYPDFETLFDNGRVKLVFDYTGDEIIRKITCSTDSEHVQNLIKKWCEDEELIYEECNISS